MQETCEHRLAHGHPAQVHVLLLKQLHKAVARARPLGSVRQRRHVLHLFRRAAQLNVHPLDSPRTCERTAAWPRQEWRRGHTPLRATLLYSASGKSENDAAAAVQHRLLLLQPSPSTSQGVASEHTTARRRLRAVQAHSNCSSPTPHLCGVQANQVYALRDLHNVRVLLWHEHDPSQGYQALAVERVEAGWSARLRAHAPFAL